MIGRKVTSSSNILQLKGRYIELSSSAGGRFRLSLIEHKMNLHLPICLFLSTLRGKILSQRYVQPLPSSPSFATLHHTEDAVPTSSLPPSPLTASTSQTCLSPLSLSWTGLRYVLDRVHKHVCGHAYLSDMKILLSRNSLWTTT